MQDDPLPRLDLASLLAAVEDAPPFSAADVLGERLANELDAREVSFLIADFSGHALVRLGHAASPAATRTRGVETAERVSLVDSSPGGRSPRSPSSSKAARTGRACSRR